MRKITAKTSHIGTVIRTVVTGISLCVTTSAFAILVSLKTVQPPIALNIGSYMTNQFNMERLGKALFWDMQVGSDGVQACASCHFHAGADSRTRNQLSPGILGGDEQYGNNNLGLPQPAPDAMRPDMTLTTTHFPFHLLTNKHSTGDPKVNPANVIRDTNDVVSSMGVMLTQFEDIVPGSPVDMGTVIPDPPFTVAIDGVPTQVRRVEPRNTPSVINAVFNFDNFMDGRAHNVFNGNNPFGPADPRPHLLTNATGSLATEELRLRQASLASQAVGPPLSEFEMSYRGRTWPKVGKKMLSLEPLAQQAVSTTDSKLGFIADTVDGAGLTTTYAAMIRAAFPSKYWNNTTQKVTFDASGIPSFQPWDGVTPLTTDEYTQMEANFSFFFGLSVQMYMATLRADDSRFDRFLEGNGFLTNEETIGMNTFIGSGACVVCHDAGAMHDIDTVLLQGRDPVTDLPIPLNQNPINKNDFMLTAAGFSLYDTGYHNTGVRPGGNPDPNAAGFLTYDGLTTINEDIGRGGFTGLGGTLTELALGTGVRSLQNINFPPTLQYPGLAALPPHMVGWVPPLPLGFAPADTTPFAGRVTNFGAFKTPGLRNIELTGPYMHNGGMSNLRQVVDFYVRGGNFSVTNLDSFDSQVAPLGLLRDSGAVPGLPTPEELRDGLVQFMMTLTDDRVANEAAPFDHPEIFVPITGTAPVSPGSRGLLLADTTNFQRVFAVGSGGRGSVGLPPLGTFLDQDPRSAAIDPDADLDLIADAADNCPVDANPLQEDGDGDTVGDVCDICPADSANDSDGDGVCGDVDNCPVDANADQLDADADGLGDVCDDDDDNDTILDTADNCPLDANTDQLDTDGDLIGDVCDDDDDNDTILDTADNCPLDANTDQLDTDGDLIGDACDNDDDNDTILDTADNCPLDVNTDQLDTDGDLIGDACDNDDDNDTILDTADNCPLVANTDQADTDGNGIGDACQDTDADTILDTIDNCTLVANANQRDTDGDLYGNSCDADFTGDNVVNLSDYSQFRSAFGQAAPGVEPFVLADHADFNGDGLVNLSDYSIFRASFGKAPGPSGLIAAP